MVIHLNGENLWSCVLLTIETVWARYPKWKSVGNNFSLLLQGYVVRISGGNDKQGFPMKQGVLTHGRVRLLLSRGHSCYRPRRTGERKRKSVRGCIVDANLSVLNLVIVKKGNVFSPTILWKWLIGHWGKLLTSEPRGNSGWLHSTGLFETTKTRECLFISLVNCVCGTPVDPFWLVCNH